MDLDACMRMDVGSHRTRRMRRCHIDPAACVAPDSLLACEALALCDAQGDTLVTLTLSLCLAPGRPLCLDPVTRLLLPRSKLQGRLARGQSLSLAIRGLVLGVLLGICLLYTSPSPRDS